ncbi:MAG: hypothetical protein LQ337_006676 [Flavoplaca oasis]|nr:MAG: hypothetical protein LQ337_006676 [Flavoplaca oasis]
MQRNTPSPEEITSALQVQCNKAAALLICWADESNHHAEYHRQIMQLRSTFEDSFGFQTTVSYLDPKALLELQVLKKVSEFAAAHDGRDNLLVVYYAGDNNRVFEQLYTWLHPSWKRGLVKVPKAPPRSITPALIMALQEMAKHPNDGNVYTTKDLFNIMRAELIVSRPGCYAKIQLQNAQCNSTLDDHIVLQPQPATRIPDRE